MDTEPKQILADLYGDEDGMFWHHRLLIVRGAPGQWVVATPTGGVQVANCAEHRVIPLERKAPFPEAVCGETYVFDETDPPNLNELKARAQSLAVVMGFDKVLADGSGGGKWVISDMSHEDFGSEIPDGALVSAESSTIRATSGW